MGFEDELKVRRAGIAAEIDALRAKAAALEGVLAAYDAVLVHCDPDAVLATVASQPRRRTPVPLPPELQRLNKTEAVLETLREAGRPISTAECVSAIADRLGVAPSHEGLRRFPQPRLGDARRARPAGTRPPDDGGRQQDAPLGSRDLTGA